MTTKSKATIEDLYDWSQDGKAEIINRELITMSPTGGDPGYAGDEIFASLRTHTQQTKLGRAVGDNKAFHVHLPNRDSFSPDAALYIGPSPGMKFYEGAPVSRSKCAPKTIMDQAPRSGSPRSARIISPRERWLCGMWTYSAPISSNPIARTAPTDLKYFGEARSPTPSLLCQGGDSRWTNSSNSRKANSMKIAILVVWLLLCGATANAKIHTLIGIDDCAWVATHIVIVTEGEQIDGVVSVLESWQGDLRPGDVLVIPELERFKSEESRRVKVMDIANYLEEPQEGSLKFVSGSRIVLFLRGKAGSEKWFAIGGVWIEEGKAYGLWDGDQRWSGVFASIGTEASLREAAARADYERSVIKGALEIADPKARIEALQPVASSRSRYATTVASVEITAAQQAAARPRTERKRSASPLPRLQCADDCAGPIFALTLERELAFWTENASKLEVGWWNDPVMTWDEVKVYRNEVGNTEMVLQGLQETRHSGSAERVRKLLALFRSLPQLSDQAYVIKGCDSFLNGVANRVGK